MRPEIAAAVGTERFLREIETAATLRHPHIVPLYDSGAVDGFLYYVMPYVEGESLRDRLNREHQLPIDEAVRLTQEVAEALSLAHGRGIVHRDIKPGNIMLEAGHAVVTDFGIARAVDVAAGEELTETGVSMGTPSYMSPEQATGERQVDARSDVYALGCVLYEMLAGEPPYTGNTTESIIRQHIAAEVPSVSVLRSTVSEGLAGVVRTAMAKAPADRYPTCHAFGEALESRQASAAESPRPSAGESALPAPRRMWPAIVTATITLLALGAWGLTQLGASVPPRIAVLPLNLIGGSERAEVLQYGPSGQINTQLTNVGGVIVRGQASAQLFFEDGRDYARATNDLGVDYLLDGTVQDLGDRLQITIALIDTESGDQEWAQGFDLEYTMPEIVAMADSVVENVLRVLGVDAELVEGLGETSVLARLDVWELEQLGEAAYDGWGRPEDLLRSRDYFQQALELDSTSARLRALLARSYAGLGMWGFLPPTEAWPEAERLAQLALEMDSTVAEAYVVLAFVNGAFYNIPAAALGDTRRALALDSTLAEAWESYGIGLAGDRDFDGGLEALRRARQLEPLGWRITANIASALKWAGRQELAVEEWRHSLTLPNANVEISHGQIVQNLIDGGHWEEARAELESRPGTLAEQFEVPRTERTVQREGVLNALEGRTQEARAALDWLVSESYGSCNFRRYRAEIHLFLGEVDSVFPLLRQEVRDRCVLTVGRLQADTWSPLHGDARWAQLLDLAGITLQPEVRRR